MASLPGTIISVPGSRRPSLRQLALVLEGKLDPDELLAHLRWPSGFACPKCGGRDHGVFRRGGQVYYQCHAPTCRHQTTAIAGTPLASCKLPARSVLLALCLAVYDADRRGLGVAAIAQHLHVTAKTAGKLARRIRLWVPVDPGHRLRCVDVDGCYIAPISRRLESKRRREWQGDTGAPLPLLPVLPPGLNQAP